MRIYLADLGHNLLTYSSDTFPLGIANVAMWVKGHVEGGADADIRLFREPEDLKAALDEEAPDILGLSNYAWNEALAEHFARYCKKRAPATLVLMGGPNWPLTPSVQVEFLTQVQDAVDAYVDGPTYEGERAFANAVTRFFEVDGSIDALKSSPVDGLTWLSPEGELVKGNPVPRIDDLDEIPSPYRSGLLDPFFETGYFPLLQISRGCPFTCTFCNSGVQSNNKVHAHSLDDVKADLLYVAERVKPEVTLCLADDNFGMYERDEDVADYLAHLQDTYGWPKYIRTTTGKNKGERIIRVMRKTRGAMPMTSAVQSMNPEVLRNIKRHNIKLETYEQLQEELKRNGLQSYGELILCLPGETKATFMDAVEKFLDAGALRVSAHQLMLLHGAELADPDSRERFGFETRFRLVARNIGNYTGEPVIETEEMVVATPTFSYQEYLETRIFHLLLTTFFYEGNVAEAFELARHHAVKPFLLATWLADHLDQAPQAFQDAVEAFVKESEEELFPDRASCIEWSKKHYDQLVDGTLGGNLLSKYSMIGRFVVTQEALDYLETAVRAATAEHGDPVPENQLSDVMQFLRNALLHVPFRDTMSRAVSWESGHDVVAWADDGFRSPLSRYAYDAPTQYIAEVTEDQRSLIETKIDTFGEHPSGLGKFTRTMFARDLRRSILPREAPTGAAD